MRAYYSDCHYVTVLIVRTRGHQPLVLYIVLVVLGYTEHAWGYLVKIPPDPQKHFPPGNMRGEPGLRPFPPAPPFYIRLNFS